LLLFDSALFTGVDSPVKDDSFTLISYPSISTPSAGILSPASIITISPGTNFSDNISCSFPSLITLE